MQQITKILRDSGLEEATPADLSAGAQYATANLAGGMNQYNQNIQNWFADPTAHTRAETEAAMQQYGISAQDIQNATGKTLDSYYAPVPTTAPVVTTAPTVTAAPVTNAYFTANPDVAAEYAKNPHGVIGWSLKLG